MNNHSSNDKGMFSLRKDDYNLDITENLQLRQNHFEIICRTGTKKVPKILKRTPQNFQNYDLVLKQFITELQG